MYIISGILITCILHVSMYVHSCAYMFMSYVYRYVNIYIYIFVHTCMYIYVCMDRVCVISM
jgi:hypothetical protein